MQVFTCTTIYFLIFRRRLGGHHKYAHTLAANVSHHLCVPRPFDATAILRVDPASCPECPPANPSFPLPARNAQHPRQMPPILRSTRVSSCSRLNSKALPGIDGDESWELPVPATFVVGQDRRVALAYVDVDYRRRLPPEEIIATLRSLPAPIARRAGTSMR